MGSAATGFPSKSKNPGAKEDGYGSVLAQYIGSRGGRKEKEEGDKRRPITAQIMIIM